MPLADYVGPGSRTGGTQNWKYRHLLFAMLFAVLLFGIAQGEERPAVLVVIGADGAEEFGKQFNVWADRWVAAAEKGKATCTVIGRDANAGESDRELFFQRLTEEAAAPVRPLWIVLIGHGTFDGKTAKFNLRGPDVTAAELGERLKAFDRPLAIINCTSCSGPFLTELSGRDRVIVTAAKSGHEYDFARFGDYFSAAVGDPSADLDKDDQTSLLEAYLAASGRVREFYASESRLATEHALLDDNGDRLGTPGDWFRGLRALKAPKDRGSLDGDLARRWTLVPSTREEKWSDDARNRRDELEKQLAEQRAMKATLPEADYLSLIEPILTELAKLSRDTDRTHLAPTR